MLIATFIAFTYISDEFREDYMEKPKKKIGLTILRYLILIAVFVGAFFGIKWFYDSITADTYEAPVTPVEVVRPEKRVVDKTLVISSKVESKSSVSVSSYVDGTILDFLVSEGDKVKDGDVIAKIDPEPYRLQYEQAVAGYTGYSQSFERVKKLYEQNIATKQDYDSVKAQTDAMKAQLELAKLQLSYTDVVAHADGTVQKVIGTKGGTAMKGVPMVVLEDLDNLVVKISVGEKFFDIFNNGKDDIKVKIVRPASNYSEEIVSTGTITTVSQYIDPTSKAFGVEIKVDDNLESLRPGMYVKVYVTYAEEEGYTLEKGSVKLDGTAYYVDSNRAHLIDLSKNFSNNDYVIIPNELGNKDFINKGKDNVLDGELVNVLEEAEK